MYVSLLLAGCFSLFVLCCVLLILCGLVFVARLSAVRCAVLVVCWLLFDERCSLFDVCCLC